METPSSHCKSIGKFLDAQGPHSSLPASIKRIGSQTNKERWRHRFPHYTSMGAFCCHGNQSFDPICPKTLCSLSPTPVMLHIKFDQDWQTGFLSFFLSFLLILHHPLTRITCRWIAFYCHNTKYKKNK